MKVVDGAIRYPVTTAVGAILVSLFGGISLGRIPVQLTPTVEEPQVGVTTRWPGASPMEIEREIVDEQEEQLKGLEGLIRMESTSSDSSGTLALTFSPGTSVDVALLKVSNRLEQVPNYPAEADKPVLKSIADQQAWISWWVLVAKDEAEYDGDVFLLGTFVEDEIIPELERVAGVASVNIFGGREDELQVIVDPAALAARQITLPEMMAALDRENRNISGGDFNEGKRRYIVRTVGEYSTPSDVEDVVVAMRGETPVYVRDVASVRLGHAKPFALGWYFDKKMIAINAAKVPGANVLDVMAGLKEAAERVNEELLAGTGLELIQVYDETEYIDSAIDLVQQSLVLGGALSIMMLLLFLRSRSSTLVVAVAIPISVVGTFIIMNALGRTINVISLAGLAFAVGMVVDNAIVVLENIYRHRQMGKGRFEAASDGATEVWGAVLASTLTTIAVFLPVLFVRQEAGQLFADIALAISCSVGLSLIVSITVIPSLSARILGTAEAAASKGRQEADDLFDEPPGRGFKNLWGMVDRAHGFNAGVTNAVYWICGSTTRRLVVVLGLTLISVGLSYLLVPKTEYLPTGNRNFVFGFILPPPGHSMAENAKYLEPYLEAVDLLGSPDSRTEIEPGLPAGGIRGFFFISTNGSVFFGADARDPRRTAELLPVFFGVNSQIPGALAFATQPGVFERFGAGRSVEVEITGPDLERLVALGGRVFVQVKEHLPEAQAIPQPSLDLGEPEVQVRTNRRRAAELGVTNQDLGIAVSALVDGAKASEYRHEGRNIDLTVKGDVSALTEHTHLIEQLPIATPSGQLVTVGSVADVEVVNGPAQIAHKERQRAITVVVTPPEGMPLSLAMETIDDRILAPMRADGDFDGLYRARMTGTADKLTQTWKALLWNFILAVVITYLLLAALFESFLYPFVILFSVPLAGLGGFLGLGVVNLFTYQALDVLTMLGFIILVGTVVNNAILIVHQSLHHIRRDGMAPREAIREATSNRIRPIFMSVGTSVFGMLPLVLFPGAGSELYRGLGSVVVGGLIVSTIFTLFLVPALLSLVLDLVDRVGARAGSQGRDGVTA